MMGTIPREEWRCLLAAALAASVGGRGLPARKCISTAKVSFAGVRGHFDEGQLQHGFKVYSGSLRALPQHQAAAFPQTWSQPGGPGLPEAAISRSRQTGYRGRRRAGRAGQDQQAPGRARRCHSASFPTSRRRATPPTRLAARPLADRQGPWDRGGNAVLSPAGHDGAGHPERLPEAGADYVYAYLLGFADPPGGMKLAELMNYNKVFPGHQTAMTNPFIAGDGLVKYDDGTPATVDNYARDVVGVPQLGRRSDAGGAQANGPAG